MVYKKCNKRIYILLPDLKGGGAEKLSVNLANHWVKLGYLVKIILLNNNGILKEQLSKKIDIIDLKITKIRQLFFKLPKVLKFDRPDVLLVSMWPLTSLAALSIFIFRIRVKVFLTEHINLSETIKNELNINNFLVKIFINMTFRLSDGIIAVSSGVKKSILDYYTNANSDQIKVIYNPVITEEMLNTKDLKYDIREIWGDEYNHRILSVGTLKEQKNHKALIKAFSLLPINDSYKLIILGDGPLKDKLQKYINELKQNTRIEIHPFTLKPEKYYQTATLFILSSKWEGFGNVLVEALFYDLPIISTNCDYGPAEILENGRYGKLVELREIYNLNNVIEDYDYSNQHKIKKFEKSMNYSVQIISKKYISLFFE